MVSNTNDYQKSYMKDYVKNSTKVICDICLGNYKLVYKYRHIQTKQHKKYVDFKNIFKII
jgi:hypothetical protein